MNCHIVPKCYLKEWKIPTTNGSIYIFDKSKTLATHNNKNIGNLSDTNFAFEDKYLIDIFNKDYMYKFYNQFFTIMKELNISATYNGIEIVNKADYENHIDNIDQWVYISRNGNTINAEVVIDLWYEKIAKVIENYFAYNIENKWSTIIEYTRNHIMRRNWKVSSKHKDILIEFIVVQLLRRFENMKELCLNDIMDLFNQISGANYFDSAYQESHWLMQLYGYASQKHNNSISKSIDYINKNYQPCFLISTGKSNFITSDNPCFFVKNAQYPYDNGIYMPINPNVCLFLCNLGSYADQKKYYIFDISDQNVKYINYQIKSHALKELAYRTDDISSLFCAYIDKPNWEIIPITLKSELLPNN